VTASRGSRSGRPAVKGTPRASLPADPVERLSLPLGQSGLSGATVLRRSGLRLGLATVRDLLFHLPRRYDDLREMRTLGSLSGLEDGTAVSARARVVDVRIQQTWKRRVQVTTATLRDETGEAEATWFGRRFIEKRLRVGDEIIVSGRLKRRGFVPIIDDPDFQPAEGADLLHVGRIVPIYRLTQGLTAVRLRQAMREALDRAGSAYPEYLPPRIRVAEGVPTIAQALEAAHYPPSFEARDAALRRIALDELLALQLGMVARRRGRGRARAPAVTLGGADDERVRASLEGALRTATRSDVSLTDDQQHAIDEIRADLGRESPMLRLLQGDVGSGKTAVAAWALAAVALAGRQAALLAPTDLLARQHARSVGDLVAGLGLPVELLTGSLGADRRRAATDAIASGMASIVVGTHALLQESVEFGDLALAVVDEQHRFGVEQRGALEAKARGGTPHVLLMTATPIPRTVGQVVYADLDVSTLRTPPAGRIAVRTGIRHPDDLGATWEFVRSEAAAGHAAFVVVPAIEESEGSDIIAAEAEVERLRGVLAGLRVGLVHGRMKAADRDAELARLRDGDLDVLVGTTVLEVGVDVPRATVMVVESAELFGLAQLHQLRGRVGRGTDQSYAVLVSPAASTAEWKRMVARAVEAATTEQARLVAVARTTDGFELAERDFELRREGDVLGLVQSGLPRLRVATLARPDHRELAARARGHAERLIDERGDLEPGHERLAEELRAGWLAGVYAGDPTEPASAA